MDYSLTERAKCAAWFEWTKDIVIVQEKFSAEFNKKPPPKNSVIGWHKSLLGFGNVQNEQRKRKKSNQEEDAADDDLSNYFEEHFSSSICDTLTMSALLSESKIHAVQKLNEEDKANRLDFAADQLEHIEIEPTHLSSLIWSDEAYFHLDGGVSRHNHQYWSQENPYWIREQTLLSPRTIVWAAVGQEGVFGPFFFDENVTSASYLKMLQNQFWRDLEAKGLSNKIIFMQDGAPPHWGIQVRNWLNKKFPERWMGSGSSSMPCPPRSPDLSPCDFFLWRFIKSKVYTSRPTNIEELKQRIQTAFDEITDEMRQQAALEYKERLKLVIEKNGNHIDVH